MTPTLMGRWQTRIYLLWTLGLLLTLLFMAAYNAFQLDPSTAEFWKLPLLLLYVTVFGFGWDVLYIFLQRFRWDHDWPLAFQLLATLGEGFIVGILFYTDILPGLNYTSGDWWRFALHYGTIWWVTFWWLFGPMRVIFPRWRFRGGELL